MTSRRRRIALGALPVLLLALLLVATALPRAERAAAQVPSPTPRAISTPATGPTDAEALAVEHQLLCPLCVNERLDVCSLAICNDMKQIVRQRLAAGASDEEIVQFFEDRYGPKVRADLPRRGFNLLLFGWVGGALLTMTCAAVFVLRSMRRATGQRAASSLAPDETGLDDLIAEAATEEFPSSTPDREVR